jgi:hypothetical protein
LGDFARAKEAPKPRWNRNFYGCGLIAMTTAGRIRALSGVKIHSRIHYKGNVYACCRGPRPIGNMRNSVLGSICNAQTIQEMQSDLIDGKVLSSGGGSSVVFYNWKVLR